MDAETKTNMDFQKMLYKWAQYLGVLDFNNEKEYQMLQVTNCKKYYNDLKAQHLDQVLSPLEEKFIQSTKLRKSIIKDVDRTYQDYDLFQSDKIKFMMIRILMIWSLKNSDVSYSQGMNEILGLLVHCSQEEWLLYCVFESIMNKLDHKIQFIYSKHKITKSDNPLLQRIHEVYGQILKKVDLKLFQFLSFIDFPPEIVLVRWYKCLLAREFSIQLTLKTWDTMFLQFQCDNLPNYKILDYIIVTLLMKLRDDIMSFDNYFEVTQFLLNLDKNKIDIENIIQNAYYYYNAELQDTYYKDTLSKIIGEKSSVYDNSFVFQEKSEQSKNSYWEFLQYINPIAAIIKLCTSKRNKPDLEMRELQQSQQSLF